MNSEHNLQTSLSRLDLVFFLPRPRCLDLLFPAAAFFLFPPGAGAEGKKATHLKSDQKETHMSLKTQIQSITGFIAVVVHIIQ